MGQTLPLRVLDLGGDLQVGRVILDGLWEIAHHGICCAQTIKSLNQNIERYLISNNLRDLMKD